jgi:ABC-type glycerol-3-phosphate transport system permease component
MKDNKKIVKNAGLLGLGLCGLCCALPVLGIIGGTGILSSLDLCNERVGLILLTIAIAFFGFWLYRKKKTSSNFMDCNCKTENTEPKIN